MYRPQRVNDHRWPGGAARIEEPAGDVLARDLTYLRQLVRRIAAANNNVSHFRRCKSESGTM